MRPRFPLVLAFLLILSGCGGTGTTKPRPPAARVDPAPPSERRVVAAQPPQPSVAEPKPLARLSSRANKLIGKGTGDMQKELEKLRGYPVVVNQWASWCNPCRAEAPIFSSVAPQFSARVAFIGIDTLDDDGAASAFLSQVYFGFPSIADPSGDVARMIGGPGRGLPRTSILDAEGRTVYTRFGAYADQQSLISDINRYALAKS